MSLPPAHPPKWRGSLALPFPLFLYPPLGPPFSFLSSCLSDQKEAKGWSCRFPEGDTPRRPGAFAGQKSASDARWRQRSHLSISISPTECSGPWTSTTCSDIVSFESSAPSVWASIVVLRHRRAPAKFRTIELRWACDGGGGEWSARLRRPLSAGPFRDFGSA